MGSSLNRFDSIRGFSRNFLNSMLSDQATIAENDWSMPENQKLTGSIIMHCPCSSARAPSIGVNDYAYLDFKIDDWF